MTETFGRQWEANFGTAEDNGFNTWSEGLADLSLEEIRDGLGRMLKSGNDFPPNLIQFRAFCKPSEDLKRVQTYSDKNFTEERIAAAKNTARLTHNNRGDTIVAMKAKAQMAAILSGCDAFDFDGQTFPVETFDESYARLGLHSRWGHEQEAIF